MKLLSFTVSHGINVMSSASVRVIAEDSDAFAIGDKIELDIVHASTTTIVFVGRITGWTPRHNTDNAGDVYELRCVAIQGSLQKCPIVTKAMSSNPIALTLAAAGLGSSFISIANEPTPGSGGIIVEENNVIQAVARIAQLNGQVWYINGSGQIRFVGFGAETGGGLFDEANVSGDVSDEYNDIDSASAIKVRGRYTPSSDSDIVILLNGVTLNCTPDDDNNAYAQITVNVCDYGNPAYFEDQIEKSVVITKDNSGGSEIIGGSISGYNRIDTTHGNLTLRFVTSRSGGFALTGGLAPVWCKVVSHIAPTSEVDSVDQMGIGTGQNMIVAKDGITQLWDLGSGTFAIYDKQANRLSNESSQDREEVTLTIPAWEAIVGTKYDEIDNPYATEAQCSVVAALVRDTMIKNTRKLSLSGPFIGLLPLSSTWSIPLIKRGRKDVMLTGCILESISISYDAASCNAKSAYVFLAGT